MKELFKIKDLKFFENDFLDDIKEYEDIIPIIEELSDTLSYDKIQCVDINDCCEKTKENYIVEVKGFLTEEDDFITFEELEKDTSIKREGLTLFVIRVYMCVECGKWIIDILEE